MTATGTERRDRDEARANAPTRLVVMGRAPRVGAGKRRLAASLGDEPAADLAGAFLEDVWQSAATVPGVEPALAIVGDEADLPALTPSPAVHAQREGELGARIEAELRGAGAAEGERALVIGADSPGLPTGLLERARDLLETHDAVLGPAEDGGFYLLGLRDCPEGLLDELPWSSPDTMERTRQRLRDRGYEVALLPPWFDVDERVELARLAVLIEHGMVSAPATRRALERSGLEEVGGECPMVAEPGAAPEAPAVSVVIPALDEAEALPMRLKELAEAGEGIEVVVADGGSSDETPRIAAAFPGVRLVRAPRGRARQMNAGAEAARAPVLLFLHADVGLPAGAIEEAREALGDPSTVAGAFRTRHVPVPARRAGAGERRRPRQLGPLLRLADVRSRLAKRPYGDQGLFVRAEVFRELGGFPEVPLMEDVAMADALLRRGRIARCSSELRVSGRRFQTRPVYYATLMNLLPVLYRAGVPTRALARLYRTVR